MLLIYFSLCIFVKFLMSFLKAQVSFPSDFRVLESKFVKFPMSVLKWQVNSSSTFALFFIVMTHNSWNVTYNSCDISCENFKVIPLLLWTEGSHQSPNFETFKCFGENLSNFSCHFSNQMSFFLQILHHSSVSWKITSMYFCSSNIMYFGHKEPIKTLEFLRLSGAWVNICENPHVNFKTTSQFLFNFCIILHCHDT